MQHILVPAVQAVVLTLLLKTVCHIFKFLNRTPASTLEADHHRFDRLDGEPIVETKDESSIAEAEVAQSTNLDQQESQESQPPARELGGANPYSSPLAELKKLENETPPDTLGVPIPTWEHAFGISALWAIALWTLSFVLFRIDFLFYLYGHGYISLFRWYSAVESVVAFAILIFLLRSMLPTRLSKAVLVVVMIIAVFISTRLLLFRMGVLQDLYKWSAEHNLFFDFLFW